VCEGLDTVATVTLNGIRLAETANMHRTYRFPIDEVLRSGPNTLTVEFAPVAAHAEAVRDTVGARPNAYDQPFQYVRKMASNFGWDWGPTLVTAGIWKRIGLHSWTGARLAVVRPHVTVQDGDGVARLDVDITHDNDEQLTITASVGGVSSTTTVQDGRAHLELRVPDVALWWPHTHGNQPLHDLEVELRAAEAPLDRWQRRIGFRTVTLDTAADDAGSAFTLAVNGRPLFVRGVNWIPDDCFPSRIDRDRYAARLRQAVDAGVDLVRVWGGGIYESDEFYGLCDELGLMVWQDFLFACAAYPEEALRDEVEAEARDAVHRLMPHPSLVLWNGNNENIWGHADWGWQEQLGDLSWGAGFYFDLLPAVCAELDPTRPYWPGSPWSGSQELHPNDDRHGNSHLWDVWNQRGYTAYREHMPRFVSEFGYQAPATYATIAASLSERPLEPDSPGMLHHQRAGEGNAKLRRGLADHFADPVDFDDWHYLTQLNQARALTLGIEHFRSLKPHCAGTIIWQLNDCWPVTSWSAVDGYGRRKPLWYALRRAYRSRLLTVQPRSGGLAAVLIEETGVDWTATGTARRLDVHGAVLAESPIELMCPGGGATTVPLPASVAAPADPAGELLVVEIDGQRSWWFYVPDKQLRLPESAFEASVEPVDGGYAVTVTARTLLRDLALFPDRLDPCASVDEQLVTLLPGESHRFLVRSDAVLRAEQLVSKPVLRSVQG
jgi:beta-mannosidase